MIRHDLYVTVTEREWRLYQKALPRSVARRMLHTMIFYSKRLMSLEGHEGTYQRNGRTLRDVVHPLAAGQIPEGYAVTEKHHRDETRFTVRSARETERTASHARGMSL